MNGGSVGRTHTRREDRHHGGARTNIGGPYTVITSESPCRTLAEGEVRHYEWLLDAAVAFVKSPAPFKQVLYDDDCVARHLNRDKAWVLESVCGFHGDDVFDVEGAA